MICTNKRVNTNSLVLSFFSNFNILITSLYIVYTYRQNHLRNSGRKEKPGRREEAERKEKNVGEFRRNN